MTQAVEKPGLPLLVKLGQQAHPIDLVFNDVLTVMSTNHKSRNTSEFAPIVATNVGCCSSIDSLGGTRMWTLRRRTR